MEKFQRASIFERRIRKSISRQVHFLSTPSVEIGQRIVRGSPRSIHWALAEPTLSQCSSKRLSQTGQGLPLIRQPICSSFRQKLLPRCAHRSSATMHGSMASQTPVSPISATHSAADETILSIALRLLPAPSRHCGVPLLQSCKGALPKRRCRRAGNGESLFCSLGRDGRRALPLSAGISCRR